MQCAHHLFVESLGEIRGWSAFWWEKTPHLEFSLTQDGAPHLSLVSIASLQRGAFGSGGFQGDLSW